MKKYALVNGKHVQYADLRETPKFLISNDGSCKIKKLDGYDYLGSGKWHGTPYSAYEPDHPYVLDLIEKEKQRYFIFYVREEIEKLYRNRNMSFEEAKKINDLLEFGVEL